MLVLGVDPGIERLGYGIIECSGNRLEPLGYGLISTHKNTPKPERLRQIYQDLNSILEKYKPDMVSVETLIFASNVKTALVVSEVRGVILLCASLKNLPVHEFTPLQVKMSLTGYGRSTKQQMEQAVKIILNLSEIPKPDDVSDAIAIAICGGNTARFLSKLK